MKPIRLTNELLATRFSGLSTVARRVAKIRGEDCDPEGDAAKPTQECPEIEPTGDVSVIEIRGILMRDCSGWFPFATDTEEIEALLSEAESDNNVSAIVLDIDSPGGCVNGTVELGELVSGITKPVVVYVSGGCHSAAYWVAAGADSILIRSSAGVGSVGVYSAVLDWSEAFAQMGISVELFKSGEQKAAGYPGTTLSDAQRSEIQKQIDEIGDQFRSHVLTYRPEVDLDHLDGRDFAGELAVSSGFADEIVSGIGVAVNRAQMLAEM